MVYKYTSSINNLSQELYNNVIKFIFPNINDYDGNLLLKYLLRVIDVIAYCFNFTDQVNSVLFIEKLRNEKYKDCIGLLNLLLPFVNDQSDKSKIISLNDIYIKKKDNASVNINLTSPKYEFSNLQYGRCVRDEIIKEINFSEDHIKHNFFLLVDTIRLVSKKLYVNWINVVPLRLQESTEYKDLLNGIYGKLIKFVQINKDRRNEPHYTNELLKLIDPMMNIDIEGKDDDNLREKLSNIQIDDIYETVTNFLYYEIKNVKWLIFDIITENKIIPISIFLKVYFGNIIDVASKNIKWINLSHDIKDIFKRDWTSLIENNNKKINVDNDELKKLLRSMIIFFDNYYKGKENLIKNKKYISFNKKQREINDEEENIIYISFEDILKSARSLNAEYVYDFIRESFNIFNNTYYSYFIYEDEYNTNIKSINQYLNTKIFNESTDWKIKNIKYPTLKNIYNYAKSYCHYTDDNNEFRELPRFWKSFTPKLKEKLLHRIGDFSEFLNWFNIRNNIKNTYGKLINVYNTGQINEQIYLVINKNIPDIVYNVLIFKGLLSLVKFKNLSESGNMVISSSSPDNQIVEHVSKLYQIESYRKSKYYLTNKPYDFHNTLVNNEKTKSTYYINYLDFNTNKQYGEPKKRSVWYKAYALDWISQINFFHKYLNNRIIYVTGSTGVGKSTVVPILLLYALKAINYNEQGKLICTQPRTTPTINNARTVSTQLGVPIEKPKDNKDKDKERDNYYVQFKYRGKKHTSDTNNLMLRFVTDGSLSLELTNPLLKKTIKDKNETTYLPDNLYDIIAVDEAHEHNANMDLILTFMRHITNYNNSVKLIIISATMEDDEPVYRRYYRDINDNHMYPLNYQLQINNFDRINVDRRLHISPPGQTTKFKIEEYYIDDHLISDPVQIAMDIIKKDPTGGDILIFRPGQGEIIRDLDRLNKILPPETIALPYYSQLDKSKKEIIENIQDQKYFIRMNKTDDFNLVDPMIGNNHYSRVIILATNIAEASITINTLKYVIETGRQKTAKYNYKKRTSILIENNISESSRLQRKGRVGRVSSGTVYYTYKKGTMENNKTQFNISVQEISYDIYKRLFESSKDSILLNKDNDPNDPYTNINISNLKSKYSNNIDKIIFNQYFILDDFFNYYGNEKHYDYNHYKPLAPYYKSGFDIYTLTDSTGDFYIVHPEELNIKRNIIGKIVGLTENAYENDVTFDGKKIHSEKMNSFWDTMFNNLYLMIENKSVFKTYFGKSMQKLQELLEFDDQKLFLAYIYGRAYGIEEEITRYICFMRSIGKYTDNFIATKNYFRQIDKVKQLVGEQQSDIIAILNVIDKIHGIININLDLSKKYNLKQKNFYNFYQNYSLIKDAVNKVENGEMLMYNTLDKENTEAYDELYKNMIPSIIYKQLIRIFYDNTIRTYCNEINIKYETMLNYLDKYLEFKNMVYNVENISENDSDGLNINDITNLIKNNLTDKTLLHNYDKISATLLMAYPYNIVKNIRRTPFYLTIYNPALDNVYSIQMVGRSKIVDTLVDKMYRIQYILYINSDIEKNTISIIHYINPKLLETVSYIYEPNKMNYIYYKYKVNTFENINNNVTSEILSNYRETLDEIKNDISIYYDNKMNNNIKDMENKFKNNLSGGSLIIDKRLYKYMEKRFKKN